MVASLRAKRAAARGDRISALAFCEPPPVQVLTTLGLHLSVLDRNQQRSNSDRVCLALAQAELGDICFAEELASPSHRRTSSHDRRRLTLAIGRWSAHRASAMTLTDDKLVSCALALAASDIEAGQRLLSSCDAYEVDSPNGALLGSALSAAAGNHCKARKLANRAFDAFGLQRPLDEMSKEPISLASLVSASCRPLSTRPQTPMPLVSILMPAHNASATITSAIKSVLAQTWRNLELIVVNDASSDETVKAAQEAFGNDRRCRIISMPKQRGTYAARNRGLKEANGEFIAFNDADDWSHPERLAQSLQPMLMSPSLMATQSKLVRLAAGGIFIAPRVFPLIRANPSSLVFRRREVVEALGGFEEIALGSDEEFMARLISHFGTTSVKQIPKLLAVASQTAGSLTGSNYTGLHTVDGQIRRLGYREAWHKKHLQIYKSAKNDPMGQKLLQRYSFCWRLGSHAWG